MSRQVIGRYALYGEIASGGMASVHLARLLGPGGFARTVAIKRLHPQYAKDPDFVSMLLDEARLAARVRHPNVVATLDLVAEANEMLLVMDYVAGPSLSHLQRQLRERGEHLPLDIASALAINLLDGLHAAHEATSDDGQPLGLVHRDVSPQNVLLSPEGLALVVDFGIAKAAGRLQSTQEGMVKGKSGYMSPEQIRGHAVDRRTDVWAASVVLWELLTQRRLFRGDSSVATLNQTLERPVEPPSALRPEVPPALDGAVMRGLLRDVERRVSTARELAVAIAAAQPPATGRDVAAWLERIDGDGIRERARQVQAVELDSSERVGVPLDPQTAETVRAPRIGARTLAIAAGFAAALGVLAWVALVPGEVSSGDVPAVVVKPAPAPEPPRAVEAPPTVEARPQPEEAGPPVEPAPRVRAPAPKGKRKPAARLESGCNPPYTTDVDGVRRWKEGC